jgi:hypothetical protein
VSVQRVVVLGAGQRVRDTILPALAALPDHYVVDGVFARSEKTIEARGVPYQTESFDNLTAARLDGVALVDLCVAKHAVPLVLRRLQACDPQRLSLMIETPVLLFKQLGALSLLDAFAAVHVSEDTSTLPWVETLAAARSAGLLGPPQRIVFAGSAWRYHGLAMTRTLLQSETIRSASRRREGPDAARVTLNMASGAVAEIIEPRDYKTGHWLLHNAPAGTPAASITGAAGEDDVLVTDAAQPSNGALQLQLVLDGRRCRGFRIGDVITELEPAESTLLGPVDGDATPTFLTDRLKAVGLMRLLCDMHAGRGGYPLELGLDDMLVDYLLEKLGRWRPSPFTSLRSSLGRRLLPTALKLVSRA